MTKINLDDAILEIIIINILVRGWVDKLVDSRPT
jgi:hypothetical protein